MWRPGAWNNPANPPAREASPLPLHSNQASSPLPGRRPSRPPLTHRTSSLSLVSSAGTSTTSLASSVRGGGGGGGGGGPRRAATVQIPPGIRDPLDVLEGILGVQLKPAMSTGGPDLDYDDDDDTPDADEEIEFGGLSLQEFVGKEERQEAENRDLLARARHHSVNTLVDCACSCSF